MLLARALLASVSLCATALVLGGCATSFDPADGAPIATSVGAINGSAYGGRQPIKNAKVYLLQARSGGDAGPGIAPTTSNASTDLLTSAAGNGTAGAYYVLTDTNGKFSMTGDYTTCTTGEQVYLYSVGGDAGGGTNTAAGLMAVLGTCGSFAFTASTTINMSEVSTIAAAYAMSGFATDAMHVGYSGSPLAKTGITNAFANANQLFDVSSNPYTTPNTLPRATTPGSGMNGGTGTVPQAQIEMLADILAGCVDSSGTPFSQCSTLFSNGKNILGTTATDTATEAIYMAQNPGNTSVYNLVGAQPYGSVPGSAPANLTIQLTFTGGGLSPGLGQVRGMEVDSSGNIWAAGLYSDLSGDPGTTLGEFSPLGVPVITGGITGIGLSSPGGLALDAASDTLWIANYTGDNVTKYTISGGGYTAYSAGGSGVGPLSIAIDSAGYPWLTNTTTAPWVQKLNPTTGAAITTLSGNNLNGTEQVAFNAGSLGDLWIANGSGSEYSRFTNSGTSETSNLTLGQQTGGVAVDGTGNVWFGVSLNGVVKVNSAGTTSHYYACTGISGNSYGNSLTIDGASNIWLANNSTSDGMNSDNAICALNSSGATISGANAYAPPTSSTQPNSIIVDLSGDVWYDSCSDSKLYEIVGAAVPVVNPISYATANSKLGQRP